MTLLCTRRRPRSAFTLIELLVVIAIIAVLAGLIGSGVQSARKAGQRANNKQRIDRIAQAISMACAPRDKGGLGLPYIPSVGPGTNFPNGFRLMQSYPDGSPELDVLLAAFPSMDRNNSGYSGSSIINMDSNQTLCFFLTGGVHTNFRGFSNNPRHPFAPPSVSDEKRRGPYLEVTTGGDKPLVDGNGRLLDIYGNPFAYFAPRGGKPGQYVGQTFSGLTPYMNGGRYVAESSFQIISAGADATFGVGGNLPATGPDADNQANFSTSVLGNGINN